MRYCNQCGRLLTMEELTHQLKGKCFDCFYPADPLEGSRLQTVEETAAWWLSDDAMEAD